MTAAASHADDTPGKYSTGLDGDYRPLDRAELAVDAATAARALLGAIIVRADGHCRRAARIVETEAYAGPEDRASHARAGRTARTAAMFGPPGHAYVYLVYGIHHCLNVVCDVDGRAGAVLVRAAEPLAGLACMRARRGAAGGTDERLAAGPARTCQALDVDRELDGIDLLTDPRLQLLRDRDWPSPTGMILRGPRIGVTYAGPDWASLAWRFGVADSPALSRPFPVESRAATPSSERLA